MNNMMLWVTIACDVLCIFAFSVTPFVTRRTELFGVSLPSAEIGRPELSAMRRAYLGISLAAGAALLVLTFILFDVFQNNLAQVRIYLILIVAYTVAEFLIYLAFHWKMQAFKATQPWRAHGAASASGVNAAQASENGAGVTSGEAANVAAPEPVLIVDTAPPAREVIHAAWLWLYAVVGVGTFLYLWSVWPSLPEKIPMHMNAAGVVDGWADKTPGGFVMLMFSQWIMIAIFVLIYFMIPISKRQIDAANPLVSREQGRRFRYRMSACLTFAGVALSAVIGFLPVSMALSNGGIAYTVVPMIIIFAIVAVMIAVAYRTGQGGSKLEVAERQPAQNPDRKRVSNTDDDSYWKLGQFYFNPNDPAAFVEKRFGVGWTINFGHPIGWIILAVIIAVVVVTLAFTRSQS